MSRVSVRIAPSRRLVVDDDAKLADLPRRVRPFAIDDDRAHMPLIVEARHRVVGLRREPGAGDPAVGKRLEHRKPPATNQPVHQAR